MNMFDVNNDDWQETPTIYANELIKLTNCVIFQNIRSLKSKHGKIKTWLSTHDNKNRPIALGLQEIWQPQPEHCTLPGYYPIAKIERKGNKPNKGGGVAFFVREDLTFTIIPVPFLEKTIEQICIELLNNNTIILNIYRPPNPDNIEPFFKTFSETIDNLRKQRPNHDLIIGGDLNLDLKNPLHRHVERLLNTIDEKN